MALKRSHRTEYNRASIDLTILSSLSFCVKAMHYIFRACKDLGILKPTKSVVDTSFKWMDLVAFSSSGFEVLIGIPRQGSYFK